MAGWLTSPATYTAARDAARNTRETDGMSEDRVEAVARAIETRCLSDDDAHFAAKEAIAALDDARDAEIARLRGLLWYGWSEMNAIRAEVGVPRDYHGCRKGICEEYWSDVVDAMAEALGDEARPWPSDNALNVLNRDRNT
jgi:hypothetical protein